MNEKLNVRLTKINEKHLPEIKQYFEKNGIVPKLSNNSMVNFMIGEFYKLFIAQNKRPFAKQELAFLEDRKNVSLENKILNLEENIKAQNYVLSQINRSINAIDYDPEGVFKSLEDPNASHEANLFKQAKNSVLRDQRKKR